MYINDIIYFELYLYLYITWQYAQYGSNLARPVIIHDIIHIIHINFEYFFATWSIHYNNCMPNLNGFRKQQSPTRIPQNMFCQILIGSTLIILFHYKKCLLYVIYNKN